MHRVQLLRHIFLVIHCLQEPSTERRIRSLWAAVTACYTQTNGEAPATRCYSLRALGMERRYWWFWDGLRSHRSRLVWDFVREQRGRLWLEFLPAYASELNPVEYLWSHWKQHELPNFCPQTFGQLSHYARRALMRMRRRPTLVTAFWQQADLFPLQLSYAMLNSQIASPLLILPPLSAFANNLVRHAPIVLSRIVIR